MFFFSSRRRHTRSLCDWSSDVCSSDLGPEPPERPRLVSGHPRFEPDSRPPLQRWAHLDSNQDLTGYEPAALPLSYGPSEIGRACVGKECRYRWSLYHKKKKQEKEEKEA